MRLYKLIALYISLKKKYQKAMKDVYMYLFRSYTASCNHNQYIDHVVQTPQCVYNDNALVHCGWRDKSLVDRIQTCNNEYETNTNAEHDLVSI